MNKASIYTLGAAGRRVTLLVGDKACPATVVGETSEELVVRVADAGELEDVENRRWLNIQDAAKVTRLSRRTLTRLVSHGALTPALSGGHGARVIFDRLEIDRFLGDKQKAERAFEEIRQRGREAAERLLRKAEEDAGN